ncbi:MAG: T9SS type A sorting domain-containing protein [Polaribacter sp.]|uniref:galactose-binding domain-containing protein n=1 Tax=Polaribacter sp. TaxID=1920175 RepID=UPI0032672158
MSEKKNKSILRIFVVLMVFGINSSVFSQTIYTNDMDYVIGDVKQRFITGAVTTEEQADNLLKGLKEMKVNGIRIPIFPRDANTGVSVNPQPAIMKYFYEQAIAEGFYVFANPAQGGGGIRIANHSLTNTTSVNGKQEATDELVNRIIEFSNEYPECKWMNPFNEDGRATNSTWSVNQINEIYQRLSNHGLNGAALIGPCTWGLPAAIDMFKNTNIADYITVATSHNLGHNDGLWDDFRALADAENLPMWDSEANNDPGSGTVNKLEAAIANKVDGLVVYNAGNNIYLSTGALTNTNYYYMSQYLKPVINLASTGTATQSSTNPTYDKGPELAIDGDINGNYGGGSVTVTNNEENPWWQVDLGDDKVIGDIKVFNRTDGCCKAVMSNFTVSVINDAGATVFSKTYTTYPNPAVTMNADNVKGRIVKVQLNVTGALTLAEVQVLQGEEQLSVGDYKSINVSIYPNPVTDIFTISAPVSTFSQYEIYTINGQRILSETVSNNTGQIKVSLNKFSKGIYLIKLNSNTFSKTYKIVKK